MQALDTPGFPLGQPFKSNPRQAGLKQFVPGRCSADYIYPLHAAPASHIHIKSNSRLPVHVFVSL